MLFVLSDFRSINSIGEKILGDNDQDIILLRDILARELETINNYQNLLAKSKRPDIRAFIAHITEEEKEHVAESIELLKELDPNQAALFKDSDHWREASTSEMPNQTTPQNSSEVQKTDSFQKFTVGSLRGKHSD